MRNLTATLVVLASLCGASLAQEAEQGGVADAPTADTSFKPEFERRPSGQANARAVPPRMLDRGVSGVAHLCCTPDAEGVLDCRVALEWPRREGLGAAALRIAEDFKLTPASLAQFQALPDRVLHVPVELRVLPVPTRVAAALDEISARTQNICGPSSTAPELIQISAERIR